MTNFPGCTGVVLCVGLLLLHLRVQVECEVSSAITVLVQNKIDLMDHAAMTP